jgi:hypothetical protein
MVLSQELQKLGGRLKKVGGYIKVGWVKFLEKIAEHSSRLADETKRKSPDRFSGTDFKSTQEVFSDFQKKRDLKPAAEDEDLSEVLNDVLQGAPPSEDVGLYAKRAPRKTKN